MEEIIEKGNFVLRGTDLDLYCSENPQTFKIIQFNGAGPLWDLGYWKKDDDGKWAFHFIQDFITTCDGKDWKTLKSLIDKGYEFVKELDYNNFIYRMNSPSFKVKFKKKMESLYLYGKRIKNIL